MNASISSEEFYSPILGGDLLSIAFMLWTLVLCSLGCIGNTLVVGAVLSYKKLRTLPNAFVFNLAVADFIVTFFISSFGMVGIVTDGAFFEDKNVLCNMIGMICITSCSCSLWSVASISLNRYVIICHRMIYPRVYNMKTLPFMIAGLWVICFLVDLPNLVGWGRHGFDERLQMCTYDYTYRFSYTLFFIGVGFGIPVCISVFCYLSILQQTRSSNKELVRSSVGTTMYNKSVVVKKQMNADRKLLKSVLIILIIFIVMWTPHSIMVLADFNVRWPRIFHVIGVALAHANSSINSFIYAAYNRDFRKGYKLFVKLMFFKIRYCCAKKAAAVHPLSGATEATHTGADLTQIITFTKHDQKPAI